MSVSYPIQLQRLAANEREALADFVNRLREGAADQILHVWFFGSKARGLAGSEADLDVLVVVADSTLETGRRLDTLAAAVNLEYGVVLSDHIVGRARYEEMARWREPILSDIRRDGIDLWTLDLIPTI
jgi:predicted nucleotidyltransferase